MGGSVVNKRSLAWMGAGVNPRLISVAYQSYIIANVRLFLFIIPDTIRIIQHTSSNTKTEIITFCHAIVEPKMLIVTLNNLLVEVVVHGWFSSERVQYGRDLVRSQPPGPLVLLISEISIDKMF